jgi:prepilin peptidase CpaA
LGWPILWLSPAPDLLRSAAGVLLVSLLAVATVTDLATRRIHNKLTYTAFLWGVLLLVAATLWPRDVPLTVLGTSEPARDAIHRLSVSEGLLGSALGFGLLFFLFTTVGSGGGDVKLITAAGLYLGPDRILEGLIYSYILAGVAALVYVLSQVGPWPVIVALVRVVPARFGWYLAFLGPPVDLKPYLKRSLPMAPFYTAGLGLAIWYQA